MIRQTETSNKQPNTQRPSARPAGSNQSHRVPANKMQSARRNSNLPVKASKSSTISTITTGIKPMLRVKQDNVKTVKAKSKKAFPVSAVVIVTICTLLLMFLVFSYVQINEYTIEVASLRGELTDLVAQRKECDRKLEEKNDMLEIEKYATENLGMVKADQLTKKHISLEQEDEIEVVKPEPSEDLTVVSSVMSAIGENFSGLWEYME